MVCVGFQTELLSNASVCRMTSPCLLLLKFGRISKKFPDSR